MIIPRKEGQTTTALSLRRGAMAAVLTLSMGCVGNIAGEDREGEPKGGLPDNTASDPRPGGSTPTNNVMNPTANPAEKPPEVTNPTAACGYLPQRAYRLTPGQIQNSIRALFGSTALASEFESDLQRALPPAAPFSNGEKILSLAPKFVETMIDSTKAVASTAVEDPTKLHDCFKTGLDAGCVGTFLRDFGLKAWRRPLTDEEVQIYKSFYEAVAAKSDAKTALGYLLRRLLTSPDFLYRFELGGAPNAAAVVALTAYETASALAYALTDAPPDAELMAAAKAGSLADRAEIERHAKRLLASSTGAPGVFTFFAELLEKEVTTDVAELSQPEERDRFIEHVLWKDGGKLSTLLTADYTFANADLLKHYGWTGTVSGWEKFTPPAAEGRAGFLSLGQALSQRGNMSARGRFIKNELLCSHVPDPPEGVNSDLDEVKAELSKRLGRPATEAETRTEHMSNPACSFCHNLIDPLGKPFWAFDHEGVWRALHPETKKPYETASELLSTGEIDGPVENARALGQKLAGAKAVRECFSKQVYQYLLGREATDDDQCHIRDVASRLEANGGDVRELFVSVVAGDGFRLRDAARK
jgi:hypothetical protein